MVGVQVHLELDVTVEKISLLLLSSSNAQVRTTQARTGETAKSDDTHMARGGWTGRGDKGLALYLQVLPTHAPAPSRAAVWSSGKKLDKIMTRKNIIPPHSLRPCSGISFKCVVRRQGLDVSFGLGEVAFYAGDVAQVKRRDSHTVQLTTVPSLVSDMILRGAGGAGAKKGGIKQLLNSSHDSHLLDAHFSVYKPPNTPAHRAASGLSLQVGCIGLSLDLDVACLVVERGQLLQELLSPLTTCSPLRTGASSTGASEPANPPTQAPRIHVQEQTLFDVEALLDRLQLHVSVSLVTAAVGYGTVGPANRHEFNDSLRFSCGGVLAVWNRVGHLACGHEYGRLSLQYLALDVRHDGSVSTLMGRLHTQGMPSTGADDDDALETAGAVGGGREVAPIVLLTVSESGAQAGDQGGGAGCHDYLQHPASPAQAASPYMLKVAASVRASLDDGRVAQSAVVRNYTMLHGCFSATALVSHLLLVNLAADRLHALDIAQQVRESPFFPCRARVSDLILLCVVWCAACQGRARGACS